MDRKFLKTPARLRNCIAQSGVSCEIDYMTCITKTRSALDYMTCTYVRGKTDDHPTNLLRAGGVATFHLLPNRSFSDDRLMHIKSDGNVAATVL